MNKLSSPSVLKEILTRHGFRFSKSLGQNFLIDRNVLDKIVSASGVDERYGVLEIGAGAGVLTAELASCAQKVVSVEIDKSLTGVLEEGLGGFPNVKMMYGDILKMDLNEILKNEFEGMDVRVVANLPYYITTPIIMKFLEEKINVKSLTVMVQKEVADRICAKAGGKEYGALSVAVQYYAEPSVVCRAEPHCFIPQPKVASVVLNLEVRAEPKVYVKDEELFFKVIKAAFGQRRKTLVNALFNGLDIDVDKTRLIDILSRMGLGEDIRGEKLGAEQFAELVGLML